MYCSIIDHFAAFSEEEQQRLQRQLAIVLKSRLQPESPDRVKKLQSDKALLRRTLARSYQRCASPLQNHHPAGEPIRKLLQHFTLLSVDHFSSYERERLRTSPFILQRTSGEITLSYEGAQQLLHDPLVRREGFLLAHIGSLGPRERREWTNWLKLNLTDPKLGLYAAIARERIELSNDNLNRFTKTSINQLFPSQGNDSSSPFNWFLKGIVPFYWAARQSAGLCQSDDETTILEAIRLGRLIPEPVKPDFGEKLTWQLTLTRERAPDYKTLPVEYAPLHDCSDERQGLLL